MQLKTQGNVSLAVACSCTFPDTMGTAGEDGETTELENPPTSLKLPVWQHFAFPVSYKKQTTKVKHGGVTARCESSADVSRACSDLNGLRHNVSY